MKKIFSIVILLGAGFANAQNTAPQLNQSLIPPSPDVASLGKFGIQPVTLYSGMPNVSVPVTEIKTTKLGLPISLSYNYNGYRPGEEASSVGLGWTLQAGGVITRMVKGKADEAWNVQHKWQEYGNILDLSTNPDFLANVAVGNIDPEPDIYIFNFNGHSGKFIMVGDRAFLFPKQDLNIVRVGGGSGFYIYSGDGTIYDFHDIETTTPASTQGSYTPPYTSAWYLSRIISDDWTETINFQYSNWTHRLASSNYSETYTQQDGGPSSVGSGCTIGTCDTWGYTIFPGAYIDAKRLVSINSKSTVVNFIPETTQRLDMPNVPTAFALQEIDIYSKPDSGLVKKLILSHDYFGAQQQLKLNAVNLLGYHTVNIGGTIVQESLTEPPYTFTYYNEQAGYPKTTRAIDKWGYYNGVSGNQTLFDQTLTGGPLLYAFADRSVHTDACANGILTQITYPTGGYTTFDYENNMIRMPGASVNIVENKQSVLTVPHSGGTTPYDSTFAGANFNIDLAQTIKVYYSRNVDPVLYPPQYGTHNFHNLFKLYLLNFDQNGDPLPPTLIFLTDYLHPAVYSDSVSLGLNPGKYYYTVTCDGTSLSASATVNYTITHLYAYQGDSGPGMRIKFIKSYDNIDNSSPSITRLYTYGNGGKFISAPGYGASTILHHYDCGDYHVYNYTSDYSSSVTTLCADQFYYPLVTEVNNDSTVTGKTVYEYQDGNMDAMGVYLSAQTDYTYRNSAYDILKYKKNTYASWDDGNFPTISFWGFTYNVSDVLDPPHCTWGVPLLSGNVFDTIGRNTLYQATSYALTSRANYLVSTDETSYAQGQTNPLTVHTAYYYDNPDYLSPSRTVVQNSKGEIITSQTKYPLDYNLTSCQPLSTIDATYSSGRSGVSNTYNTCKSNRYNAAFPYLNHNIPNSSNQALLNILRQWKCEDNYPENYAPVLNQLSTASVNVHNCYDPAFHVDPDASIISLQRNNVQVPIEQIVSITKNGSEYLQSATKTDYGLYVNSGIYGANPKTLSQTVFSQTPVLKSTFLNNPANYYLPRVNFAYNTSGNIIEQYKTNDVKEDYVWDYNNQYAIAKAINADGSISATSFESNGKGNFTFSGTGVDDQFAVTGKKTYPMYNGSISKENLDPAKTYIVSYWSDNGAKNVNDASAVSGRSLNGYTYYEHKVINPPGGTITISGTGKIDELRLYPDKALMTTFTYEPLVGISSQCDANNKISYYIYDALGRLQVIKDQDRNVVKKFCYNYAGQPVNCAGQAVYHNTERSQNFTRNNCSPGQTGSVVTYTVLANVYTSYISQAEADQQAQNDINANGQAYANAHGVCNGIGNTCNSSNCSGNDKKCINGVCETGIKVYTSSILGKNGLWICTYHYEFSDGSWSASYTETSTSNCLG